MTMTTMTRISIGEMERYECFLVWDVSIRWYVYGLLVSASARNWLKMVEKFPKLQSANFWIQGVSLTLKKVRSFPALQFRWRSDKRNSIRISPFGCMLTWIPLVPHHGKVNVVVYIFWGLHSHAMFTKCEQTKTTSKLFAVWD